METFKTYEQTESNNSKKDIEMERVFEESESQLKNLKSSMNTEELYDVLNADTKEGESDLFSSYLEEDVYDGKEFSTENEYLNEVDTIENGMYA